MSHRELWVIAFCVEAVLMTIGVTFINSSGSLSLAIVWIATQMPSHAISNWIIAGHFDSNAPFFILTFILQGTLFGSVLSIFKWLKTKLSKSGGFGKEVPVHPSETTRGK